MTSWPGRVWARTETRLPWVPDVTNSAASLPSRSAASASSRRTVGSSSHTSSPTSARAIASRISAVGSVSVSERRSTTSCMRSIPIISPLPLGAQPGAGPAAELGVGVFVGQPEQQLAPRRVPAFAVVHLGQQPEGLRDDQRARILLEHQLQALARAAGVALVEVVGGDPELLLGLAAARDIDLGQGVGGVAALGILLDQPLELLEGLAGQGLVLLDRLDLVVVRHGEPVLDEVGDLVAGVEGKEGPELGDGLVELALPVVTLPQQEPAPRRVRRGRMALDDLLEGFAGLRVRAFFERLLAELVELLGGQDGRGRRPEPAAERPASGCRQEQAREQDSR